MILQVPEFWGQKLFIMQAKQTHIVLLNDSVNNRRVNSEANVSKAAKLQKVTCLCESVMHVKA